MAGELGELVWKDGHDVAPQLRAAVAAEWTPQRPPNLGLLGAVLARTADGSLRVTARIRPPGHAGRRGDAWELVLEYPADEAIGAEGEDPGQAAWWATMFLVHVEEWWYTRVLGAVLSASVVYDPR
jgi:hypothetical protein